MTAVASILVGLSLAAQCAQDAPGPGCPRNGVVHEMVGTVEGKTLRFVGWHDADGRRKYLPEGNPEFHAACQAAAMDKGVGAALPAANYGVNLSNLTPGQADTIRTNDPVVGAALNGSLESGRPCPPDVCPTPSPDPLPSPSPPWSSTWIVIGIGAALALCGFVVLVGALTLGLWPRKATAS